ncbi:MAG: hypothetical protein JJ896_02450 [Rhodothermales bacterium]|nr:hypothetical protein [Rhodothermales bacterium]MBO6778491.1 hypothetical protein [Rhodothermales bacterium]
MPRRLTTWILACGLLLFGATACSSGDSGADEDGQPTVQVERVWALGSAESADFGVIEAIEVDEDGTVYIADRGFHQVIKVSPDGQILKRVGQRGAGPGEFAVGPRFLRVSNASVFVLEGEVGSDRMHEFDKDLNWIATHSLNPEVRPTNGLAISGGGHPVVVRSGLLGAHFVELRDGQEVELQPIHPPRKGPWSSIFFDVAPSGALVVQYRFLNRTEVHAGSASSVHRLAGLPAQADSAEVGAGMRQSPVTAGLSAYPTNLLVSHMSSGGEQVWMLGAHKARMPHRTAFRFDLATGDTQELVLPVERANALGANSRRLCADDRQTRLVCFAL